MPPEHPVLSSSFLDLFYFLFCSLFFYGSTSSVNHGQSSPMGETTKMKRSIVEKTHQLRKPWQLKARSIFLLFADGWVSSCPAGEEDSGLAGLARSIAKRESQPMALKPEIRICSGRIYHIIAYLFCPVLSWLSLSRLAICLAVRPSCLAGWFHLSKLPRRVHKPNQPN
ncbi:hypothetical protein V8C40DRAFT_221353 [Trichoderma camerunense]